MSLFRPLRDLSITAVLRPMPVSEAGCVGRPGFGGNAKQLCIQLGLSFAVALALC